MLGLVLAGAVVILDAWAILDVFNSGKSAENKALWIALILVLPLAGPLLYYVLTRRGTMKA